MTVQRPATNQSWEHIQDVDTHTEHPGIWILLFGIFAFLFQMSGFMGWEDVTDCQVHAWSLGPGTATRQVVTVGDRTPALQLDCDIWVFSASDTVG